MNIINPKKEPGSVSPNQKKIRRYVKGLKDIVDLYNLKSGSDTSNIGKGLKILTNKQMLNHLPILLAHSIKLKNETRQILVIELTKIVYNKLIKSI